MLSNKGVLLYIFGDFCMHLDEIRPVPSYFCFRRAIYVEQSGSILKGIMNGQCLPLTYSQISRLGTP